ncbi:MAG: hypothetical protein WC344_00455 [Bacilli bacterium]|jgi:uncharacterized metal-binding protein YceD (DUF177 family)
MLIAKSKLILDKTIPIQKNFVFNASDFTFKSPLLNIDKCFGDLEITKYRNFIRLNVDLEVIVTLECSYTLEPFKHESKIHEAVLISDSLDFDEEAIVVEGDNIDIERILFPIISSSLPLKPIKPGARLPESGEGYRVLNDEELAAERSKSGNSQLTKLGEITEDDDG